MTRPRRHEWIDAVVELPADNEWGIDGLAVAVATALWHHMSADAVCWPSQRVLARNAKCSRNLVDDRIERLEAAGLLAVTRRHRSANTYTGRVPTGSPHEPDGRSRTGSPERVTGSPERVTGSSQPVTGSRGEHQQVNREPVNSFRPVGTSPTAPPSGPPGSKGDGYLGLDRERYFAEIERELRVILGEGEEALIGAAIDELRCHARQFVDTDVVSDATSMLAKAKRFAADRTSSTTEPQENR